MRAALPRGRGRAYHGAWYTTPMDPRHFEQLVARALDDLPARVTRELDNIAFVAEPHSPGGRLLGEYVGVPRPGRLDTDIAPLPDRIVLYRDEILASAAEEGVAPREEIRRVLLHEIGHHLGWDDARIEAVERGRGWR